MTATLEKVWGGVFRAPTDPLMDAFGASLAVDARLAPMDALANHAHVGMLLQAGILPAEAANSVLQALGTILAELDAGSLAVEGPYEDVHTWLEAQLADRCGAAAENLRLARSRNDLVATDLRLWVRQAAVSLAEDALALQQALLAQAGAHAAVPLPGYTHLQRAQPVTVGHHLLAWVEMLDRDVERLAQAFAEAGAACPMGAGSLATSTWPIQPDVTAAALGFDAPFRNSMDAVSDRDFVIGMHHAVTLCLSHLSRMAEDLILWTTAEFGFATLPDAFSTGSSLMPQKRNPDLLELIRGRAAMAIGNLTGALALLKGLPLTYNRDLQEDKPPLFASCDMLAAALRILAPFVAALRIDADACAAALQDPGLLATDAADRLVRAGCSFAEAHRQTGAALAAGAPLPSDLSVASVLAQKTVPGGPGFSAVAASVAAAGSRVESRRAEWAARRRKDRAPYETAKTAVDR